MISFFLITKTGVVCVIESVSLYVCHKEQFHLTQTTLEGHRGCHSNTLFRWLSGDDSRGRGWRLEMSRGKLKDGS